MQQVVSQPLVAPPPDKPMLRCDTYERLWSSGGGGVWGAVGPAPPPGVSRVDPAADLRGVAVWRPQPPPGYVILGDVAVPGVAAQPSAPVAVLAINSGLVAWPSGFECVWAAAEGVALWMPVAPEGYVSMGCVATPSREEPPPPKAVACVAAHAVVAARPGACLMLCAGGNLWAVSNAAGTFLVGGW